MSSEYTRVGMWAVVVSMLGSFTPATAALPVDALPELGPRSVVDPRLEPIPGVPIHLKNFNVLGTDVNGQPVNLTMRFPPRVNGQNQSDGDKHADMYVFYWSDTNTRVPGQLPVVEAVPLPLTASNLKARLFSPIWELSAVLVDRAKYHAAGALIDSVAALDASHGVEKILQTNIFLNCPIVPAGTTVDDVPVRVPNIPKVQRAFFEEQIIHFVPYDIEDGGFNPQILYIFKDAAGNILTNPDLNPGISNPPHMVASKAPGEPFYSTIWEIWEVTVPAGVDVTTIKSASQITNGGVPVFGPDSIKSTGIRLNCPVIAIDGVTFPFENAFALLDRVMRNTRVTGNENQPVHLAESKFKPSRTFLITEVTLPAAAAAAESASDSEFPLITPDGPPGSDKGNVIPIVLRDPYLEFSDPTKVSGPNTTGDRIRIGQSDIDSLRLPAAIEGNISRFIADGLLSPEWAPGVRPYQERLGQLVGRAIFEQVWRPEDGGNQKDVTSCLACHSMSHAGGAARGIYDLRRDSDRGGNLNAGSMWGGGAAELLRQQLVTSAPGGAGLTPCPTLTPTQTGGGCTTFAHGSTGGIASLRSVVNGAFNSHMGMQSPEFILGRSDRATQCGGAVNNLTSAEACDYDHDNVSNELTVGEVTAVTAFLATLPVPRQANDDTIRNILGTSPESVQQGKDLFRRSIDDGGAGCAACHRAFTAFPGGGTVLKISNPATTRLLPIKVSYHTAEQADVTEGLAQSVGQPGLRSYGDMKLHKMGDLMRNGNPERDVMKTAELWDAGSVFPWGRDGRWGGTQLKNVILAHQGTLGKLLGVSRQRQTNFLSGEVMMSSQTITISNKSSEAIGPLRAILVGSLSPGILASNHDGTGANGDRRQGANWSIPESIPAGGSVTLTLTFENPTTAGLQYGLVFQTDFNYSEAVASIDAFRRLGASRQLDIQNFLRAQLIGGKVGEGSGLVAEQ